MAGIRPAAAVLALFGSLGVGFSAYLDWLDGRAPDEIPIRLLVDDVTGEAPSYWRSLAVPLGIASVVGIVGVLLRSRSMLALAFIVWPRHVRLVDRARGRPSRRTRRVRPRGRGVAAGRQRSGAARRRRSAAPVRKTSASREPDGAGLTRPPARHRCLSPPSWPSAPGRRARMGARRVTRVAGCVVPVRW
jgi:hypothetical protein